MTVIVDGQPWTVEPIGTGIMLTRPGAARHVSTGELDRMMPAGFQGLEPAECGWWKRVGS